MKFEYKMEKMRKIWKSRKYAFDVDKMNYRVYVLCWWNIIIIVQ